MPDIPSSIPPSEQRPFETAHVFADNLQLLAAGLDTVESIEAEKAALDDFLREGGNEAVDTDNLREKINRFVSVPPSDGSEQKTAVLESLPDTDPKEHARRRGKPATGARVYTFPIDPQS